LEKDRGRPGQNRGKIGKNVAAWCRTGADSMDGAKLIKIGTVTTEAERELLRSALESYGIEVVFRSSLPSSVYPGLTPIKVFVPGKDADLAKSILSETAQPTENTNGLDETV